MLLNAVAYDRQRAIAYAQKWALKRNPSYYDFSEIGGDCTNFISQCIYSGCPIMNYSGTLGWYYTSSYSRSPSWTGVDFFFNFIIHNKSCGPYGSVVNDVSSLDIGDIIQLGSTEKGYYHSLLVIQNGKTYEETLIATHTYDAYRRALSTYKFDFLRSIHIIGGRA